MTDSSPLTTTLFRNVRVFDGTTPNLSAPSDVLVRGGTIERISPDVAYEGTQATIIDGHPHARLYHRP